MIQERRKQPTESDSSSETSQYKTTASSSNCFKPSIAFALKDIGSNLSSMPFSLSPSPEHHDRSDVFFDAPPNQPNSGRRRPRAADLQRQDATSSRVDKIRDIFEVAAGHLAAISPRSGYTSRHVDTLAIQEASKAHLVRLSVHKTNSDYGIDSPRMFDHPMVSHSNTPDFQPTKRHQTLKDLSPSKLTGRSPSNGRNTPSRIPRFVRSPLKTTAGCTHGQDSDDEDIHSTHGVPLIMPIRNFRPDPRMTAANVSEWLETVEDESHDVDGYTVHSNHKKQTDQNMPDIKGKENVPPTNGNLEVADGKGLQNDFSTGRNQTGLLKTKALKSSANFNQTDTAHTVSHQKQMMSNSQSRGTPPSGLLSAPPRRPGMSPRDSLTTKALSKHNTKIPGRTLRRIENFANPPRELVSNEQETILKLSPSVTQRRKGRCAEARDGETKMRSCPEGFGLTSDQDLALSLQEYEEYEDNRRGQQLYKY